MDKVTKKIKNTFSKSVLLSFKLKIRSLSRPSKMTMRRDECHTTSSTQWQLTIPTTTTGGTNTQHTPETHNGRCKTLRSRTVTEETPMSHIFTGSWLVSSRTKVTTTGFCQRRTERVMASRQRCTGIQRKSLKANRKMCKSLQGFLPLNRIPPGWYRNYMTQKNHKQDYLFV